MSVYDKETKFYWLQLKEDFFEDDAIEWLEEQEPNGRDYAYFYLKLCLKSLKTNGILIRNVGNILIPYDNKKLAELTKMDFDTVTVAMELLKQIGLVQILENGEIYVTQLENLIGSVSKGALKKQQQLALRKNRNNNLETIKDKSNKLLENVIYDETGLPILHKCIRLTREQIQLPTGKVVFVDEKRYGGNGGLAYERANGLCEDCGSSEELRIHHENGYSNNLEDLIILCNSCHGIHHSKKYKELKDGGQGVENIPPKIEYKVKDKTKDKDIYIILFNKFWDAYPKKRDKGRVEKWFTQHKPTEELVELMIKQIERLKDTKSWKENNGQYIPYPSTWLNAKGWEDEFETDSEREERVDREIMEGTYGT